MLSTYMCVLMYIKACTSANANTCIEFIWKDTGEIYNIYCFWGRQTGQWEEKSVRETHFSFIVCFDFCNIKQNVFSGGNGV